MHKKLSPALSLILLILSVSDLSSQALVRIGNTNFPINDNTSVAPGSAINSGWQINGIGKIITVVPHPSIVTKLYACTASGGIYVTLNSGTSWAPVQGSFLPGVQFGCLGVDPSNNNVMYAGTGEPSYAQVYGWGGYGVFKSFDGGATWNQFNTGMGNLVVLDLLVNPINPQEVIAATRDGIYKSVNGGNTWTAALAAPGAWVQQVKLQAGNTLVAIGGTRFYRSVDFGNTWSTTDLDPAFSSTFANGRLAVAPSNSNVVYAGWVNNTFSSASNACIFYSVDGGASFTKKYAFANAVQLISYDGTSTTGYGWANFILTVSLTDPNTVYSGGHLIYKSTNNGVNWSPLITQWWCCIHTDIRQLLFDPNNANRLLASTDGGVFVSTDGGTNWLPLSNGLNCSQYLSMGQSNIDPDFVVGGLQDNGIMYNNIDGNYHTYTGGDLYDHMTCDYTNAYRVYSSNSNGKVFNPYNRTQRANLNLPANIVSSSTANSRQSFFISPLDPAIAYGWGTNVYRSSNMNSYDMVANTSSVSWSQISTFNVTVKDVKVSPASNDVLYAIGNNATIYKSINATAGAPVFTPYTLPAGASSSVNASLTVSTLNPNVLYATANSGVYRSTDAGQSWVSYTATGLPNINLIKIFADPYSTIESVYVITSLGVYYRDLTMAAWAIVNPQVIGTQQNVSAAYAGVINGTSLYKGTNSSNSHVSFATWGSGIWKATFYNQLNNALPAPYSNIDIGAPAIAGSGFYDATKQTFNVNGAGTGLNASSTDQFNFTRVGMFGNGDLIAKVYSVEETDAVNGLSKQGVMLRATTANDAPYVMISLTGHAGAMWQYRSTAGGVATIASVLPAIAVPYPYWLKINKTGNLLTASTSADGSVWVQAGQVTVDLGTNFLGGIAITSTNETTVNNGSASMITANNFVLPLQNLVLQAAPKGKDKVSLNWSFETDERNNALVLERSTDGVSFTSMHQEIYPNPNGSPQKFGASITDETPFTGNNYYRLRVTGGSGNVKYSSIQIVNIRAAILVRVEPNPVAKAGELTVTVSGIAGAAKVILEIYDISGRKVQSATLTNTGINKVRLNNLPEGTYTYQALYEGQVVSGKLLVTAK